VIGSDHAGEMVNVVHHALHRLPAVAQERADEGDTYHAASVSYGLGLLIAEVTRVPT